MGLSLLPWAISAFLALGAVGYWTHCEKVKRDQAQFVSSLEQQAAGQKKRNDARAEQEKQAKEQADENTKRNLDSLHGTIARLRNAARSGASIVPAAASCAGKPDTAAFDRAELDRALRNFTEGVSVLIGEGSEAVVQLDGAKGWALKLATELKSGG